MGKIISFVAVLSLFTNCAAQADYREVVNTLDPDHYYSLNETGGGGTIVSDTGTLGGVAGELVPEGVQGTLTYNGPRPAEGFCGFNTDNSAYDCQNDSSIRLGDGSDDGTHFASHEQMSVVMWFKAPIPNTTSPSFDRLFTNNKETGSGLHCFTIVMHMGSYEDAMYFCTGSDVASARILPFSTLDVRDGQWHFLLAVRVSDDADDTLVVIDGVDYSDQLTTTTGWCSVKNASARISGRKDTENNFYGMIDEVGIWLGTALTVEQGKDLYKAGISSDLFDISSTNAEVSESGIIDTYTISLVQEPNTYHGPGNVFVTATRADGQIIVVGGNSITLTFTPADWNMPQTITIGAVDDEVEEGLHTSSIIHSVTSDDPSFNNTSIAQVTVLIADNDVPGVTITESDDSTDVVEGGAGDSYTVVLDTEPNAIIQVTVDADDLVADETTVNVSGSVTLTFTAANWDIPQTVMVAAVQDSQKEGDHVGRHTFTVTGGNAFYGDVTVDDLWINITDDDATQALVGRWEFDESNVDIFGRIVGDSATDFHAELDYDSDVETPTLFEKAGTDYHYMTAPGDDDPNYSIMVFDKSGSWNYLPKRDITIEAWIAPDSTSDTHRGIIGCQQQNGGFQHGWSLACRASRFKTGMKTKDNIDMGYLISSDSIVSGQWYHVVATYDGSFFKLYMNGKLDVEEERTGDISYADAAFTISEYIDDNQNHNFEGRLQEVRIYNYALDSAAIMDHYVSMPPGSMTTISEVGGSTSVSEEGLTSDSYIVVLDAEPNAGSVVLISVKPPADLDVGAGAGVSITLTFTTADWDTAQTITITAVDDDEFEGVETATIRHNISSSADPDYEASCVRNVYVEIADNDCGTWGYWQMDLNEDCQVDLYDFAEFAAKWKDCTMPHEAGCIDAR